MAKSILTITTVIVAVIALGATATHISLRQGDETVRRQGEVATAPEQPTTTEPIDTSDWKTYRNEDFGFELKYSATWLDPSKKVEKLIKEGNK